MSEVLLDMYQYYIYDLPLYNNYENVYDTDFATLALYEGDDRISSEVATEIFNHLIKTGTVENGLISFDKRSAITIEFDNIDDIYRAKYIMLIAYNTSETISKAYYYFITDRTIQAGSCVATLYLDRDVWQSNLSSISNNSTQFCSRATCSSKIVSYRNSNSNYYRPQENLSFETDALLTHTNDTLIHPIIIWCKIIVDTNLGGDFDESALLSGLYEMYYPMFVVDTNKRYTTNIPISRDGIIIEQFNRVLVVGGTDEWVVSKTITATPPFLCTYNTASNEFIISTDGTDVISMAYRYWSEGTRKEGFTQIITSYKFPLANYERSTRVESVLSEPYSKLYLHNEAFSIRHIDTLKYPFIKLSIRIENTEVEIPRSWWGVYSFYEGLDFTGNWYVNVFTNGGAAVVKLTDWTNNFYFGRERSAITNKDSLTEFLRSNVTAFSLNTLLTSLSSIPSALKSLVEVADKINNAPILSSASDGIADVSSLYWMLRTTTAFDEKEIKRYSKYFDLYGVKTELSYDLMYKYHLYYDYFEVINPTNIQGNSDDIIDIINILRQGVRIWHFYYFNSSPDIVKENVSYTPCVSFSYDKYNYDEYMITIIDKETP